MLLHTNQLIKGATHHCRLTTGAVLMMFLQRLPHPLPWYRTYHSPSQILSISVGDYYINPAERNLVRRSVGRVLFRSSLTRKGGAIGGNSTPFWASIASNDTMQWVDGRNRVDNFPECSRSSNQRSSVAGSGLVRFKTRSLTAFVRLGRGC